MTPPVPAAAEELGWPERLPAGMDLLALPFDQYQRYSTAADLLRGLGLSDGARVLEVGAAPGPLERFLPEMELFFTDRYGEHAGRYVVADGAKLPFRDEAFDAVVTLDTLEHVPAPDRPAFLAECRRVSRDLVVLSAPHASPYVDLAEDALHAFVKARFGTSFTFLEEHRGNGLPVSEETVAALGQPPFSAVRMPSGYLPRWVLAMLVHHELLATGLPSLPELHAYYNATVSPADARDPAYRSVVLAARSRPVAELQTAVDRLVTVGSEDAARAGLVAIGGTVLGRRLESSPDAVAHERELSALREQVTGLERVVADRDGHLLELRQERDRLLTALETAATALERERRESADLLVATVERMSLRKQSARAVRRLGAVTRIGAASNRKGSA